MPTPSRHDLHQARALTCGMTRHDLDPRCLTSATVDDAICFRDAMSFPAPRTRPVCQFIQFLLTLTFPERQKNKTKLRKLQSRIHAKIGGRRAAGQPKPEKNLKGWGLGLGAWQEPTETIG